MGPDWQELVAHKMEEGRILVAAHGGCLKTPPHGRCSRARTAEAPPPTARLGCSRMSWVSAPRMRWHAAAVRSVKLGRRLCDRHQPAGFRVSPGCQQKLAFHRPCLSIKKSHKVLAFSLSFTIIPYVIACQHRKGVIVLLVVEAQTTSGESEGCAVGVACRWFLDVRVMASKRRGKE